MKWKPIRTAPNTAELVLVFDNGAKRARVCRADDIYSGAYWVDDYSHWMPLPAPPKPLATEARKGQ